jgi:hypothetical protein
MSSSLPLDVENYLQYINKGPEFFLSLNDRALMNVLLFKLTSLIDNGGTGGGTPIVLPPANPQIFDATEDGVIAAGAVHISIEVLVGSGTFDGYPVNVDGNGFNYPELFNNRTYREIPYTINQSQNSVFQFLVIR